MPSELLAGLLCGVVGFAVTGLWRRLDWGLVWTAVALAGLTLLRPRWTERLADLSLPLTAVAVLSIGLAIGQLFRRGREESAWIFLISLGGAFATVPDTESISVLLGLTLPLAIASEPLRLTSSSSLGGALVGVLSAIVVVTEGVARTGSVIGAAGAMAVAALPGEGRIYLIRHLVLVAVWSRIAGRLPSGLAALAIGLSFTITLLGAEWIWRRRRALRGPAR